MRTRAMALAAALAAAVGCKTSGAAQTGSAANAGDRGDSATRDGQRVAVEGEPSASQAERTVAGAHDRLDGRVALVDAQNHEIAVDSGQATRQVKVDPSATITIDGRKATLSDLKQGQEVRVRLDETADGAAAKEIEVTRASE